MVFQTLSKWAGNLLDDIAELRRHDSPDIEKYDTGYIAETKYELLHTEKTAEGLWLRCELCGRQFIDQPRTAFEHVAGHQSEIGDAEEINPFENTRGEEAHIDYSDLLSPDEVPDEALRYAREQGMDVGRDVKEPVESEEETE